MTQSERDQMYVKFYQERYNDFIEEGVSKDKAQAMAYECTDFCKELIEEVLDELFYERITVRKVFPVKLIKDWDHMSDVVKNMKLEGLGFNVVEGWRERSGDFVFNSERWCDRYIEGGELCSEEWIKSGYASWEAQLEEVEGRLGRQYRMELENKMSGR